jgi:hypothetical protein
MDGPVLRSPSGDFAAYVHAEAIVKAPVWTDCFNTTSLFVKIPGDPNYQAVYVKKPESSLQGNGLKLIAWSHKGHTLVAELTLWQYDSDFGGLSIVLYDADRKRAWEPDLAALFSKRFGKECAFAIPKVIGFDDQDRVLFEAGDYYEEGDDEPIPDTRCLGHPGIWALDAAAGDLSEVRGEPN